MDALKATLIDAGRVLEAQGQKDYTRGHVSVRLPDDPGLFLMKPQRFGFEEMTEGNIVTVDLDGRKVAGDAPRHSEAFIHSEILKARPDVQSVVHSHPVHAVAFGALGRPMQPIGQPSTLFVGRLPVFEDTIDLVTTPELGARVAQTLGSAKALLLKNHGIVTAGATVAEAVYLALMLEDACRLELLCLSAGGAQTFFPDDQVRTLGERLMRTEASETTFAYLRRTLAR